MSEELVYAIDFGTSNSLLAAATADALLPPVALDPAAPDPTVLRSILYTPHAGTWFFGARAIDEYAEHGSEGRIFRSVKKFLPEDSFNGTGVHGKFVNLSELVGVFLKEMRQRANEHYDRDVTTVVLGRPAAFAADGSSDTLAQRRLEAAARFAGFKDISFCPEPVAAAYEFRHQLTEPRTVLIADFGGGTSDFTILRMSREGFGDKDVLALRGLSVAGDRFDGAMMRELICPHFGTDITYKMPMGTVEMHLPRHLVSRLCSPADIPMLGRHDINNLLKDAQRWSLSKDDALRMNRLFALVEEHLGYKLFQAIERTKIRLSDHASDRFQFLHPGIDVELDVQAADFQKASADCVEKIVTTLDQTVQDAGLTYAGIDLVCCTGGTARIPALAAALERRFGADKLRGHKLFHAVVHGLAERAQRLLRA